MATRTNGTASHSSRPQSNSSDDHALLLDCLMAEMLDANPEAATALGIDLICHQGTGGDEVHGTIRKWLFGLLREHHRHHRGDAASGLEDSSRGASPGKRDVLDAEYRYTPDAASCIQ